MYISTSYYRVLVQELRVFRPQNAPNSVPWNMVTGQYTRVYTRGSVGTLPSPGRATVPSLAEGHEGPRFQLEPFLTRLTHPRKRGGPEAGRTGIPCEFA